MVQIYPNPASDYFTIESDDVITEVVIINSVGTEFPVMIDDRTDQKVTIRTSDLSNGTYLIGLSTQSTWVMKKIVINR